VNTALVDEVLRNDRENIAARKRRWKRRWTICMGLLLTVSGAGAVVAILVLAIAPWALLNENCGWQPRAYFGAVYMTDGRLLLVGGRGADSNFGDVWESSKEAEEWSLVTDAAEFGPRHGHALLHVTQANELLVIAGSRGAVSGSNGLLNDVWRSADGGKQWLLQTSSAPWPARKFLAAAVDADGVIYITGGRSGFAGAGLNDLWRSVDSGRSWIAVSLGSPWTARDSFAFVRLPGGTRPGRFYVMGGDDGQLRHDVWLSDDNGRNWALMRFTHTREMRYSVSEDRASWSPRAHAAIVADNQGLLTLTGGFIGSSAPEAFSSEVWQLEAPPSDELAWQDQKSSEDRLNRLRQPLEWQLLANPPWTARRGHQSVVDGEGVPYVLGGEDAEGFKNDAWKMTSSIAWGNLKIALENLRSQATSTLLEQTGGGKAADDGTADAAPPPVVNTSAAD